MNDLGLTEHEEKVVKALAEHDLNVGSAAESLWLHRNSLVYQINKIRDKTGYDPRSFWGCATLLKSIFEDCGTTEFTITFNAQVTKVIKSNDAEMERFLTETVPEFINKEVTERLNCDDVIISDYKVFPQEVNNK